MVGAPPAVFSNAASEFSEGQHQHIAVNAVCFQICLKCGQTFRQFLQQTRLPARLQRVSIESVEADVVDSSVDTAYDHLSNELQPAAEIVFRILGTALVTACNLEQVLGGISGIES